MERVKIMATILDSSELLQAHGAESECVTETCADGITLRHCGVMPKEGSEL